MHLRPTLARCPVWDIRTVFAHVWYGMYGTACMVPYHLCVDLEYARTTLVAAHLYMYSKFKPTTYGNHIVTRDLLTTPSSTVPGALRNPLSLSACTGSSTLRLIHTTTQHTQCYYRIWTSRYCLISVTGQSVRLTLRFLLKWCRFINTSLSHATLPQRVEPATISNTSISLCHCLSTSVRST